MAAGTAAYASEEPASQPQEEYIATFFVRALYDYQSPDPSALSFRRGDIIEVLTRLESGWWDGLLGEERGWFPSNYVAVVDDAELDSTVEFTSQQQPALADDSVVDMAQALSGQSDSENEWANGASNPTPAPTRSQAQPASTSRLAGGVSSDFWVPQVSRDGQVFYVNTQTGQHARDLPTEADSDLSDHEQLMGLGTAQSSRVGTGAGLGLANSRAASNADAVAGFGLAGRSGTPEPWVRRLADDGMTFYYWNKSDGTISWTYPERTTSSRGTATTSASTDSSLPLAVNGAGRSGSRPSESPVARTNGQNIVFQRLRAGSSASQLAARGAAGDRLSVYSDSSEVHPHNPRDRQRTISDSSASQPATGSDTADRPNGAGPELELTVAEQSAQALQRALAPPPPETIAELSMTAQAAINAAVAATHATRSSPVLRRGADSQQQLEADQDVDERVSAVILAVRHLLYVSALPSGAIPSGVLPGGDVRSTTSASLSVQSQLKPAQRKVTATLSKLVLSARAAHFDASGNAADSPARIETDAAELQRALTAFVQEVQKCQKRHSKFGVKRIRGVFNPAGIGLGLLGAGAAGSWKGFGWVALEDSDEMPERVLGTGITGEVRTHVDGLGDRLQSFVGTVRDAAVAPQEIVVESRSLVIGFHTLLSYVSEIHIARHVDVDGIQQNPAGFSPNHDLYMKAVTKARALVRALEIAIQAIYDDTASFLLSAQSIRPTEDPIGASFTKQYARLAELSIALSANVVIVPQTLEALLAVGHEQAELAQGDYDGSIEWRMSRLSVIEGAMRPTSMASFVADRDADDVVDMELAFSRPALSSSAGKPFPLPMVSVESSTLGRFQAETSGSSLELEEASATVNGDVPSTTDRTSTVGGSSRDGVDDDAEEVDGEAMGMGVKTRPRKDLVKILGDDAPKPYLYSLDEKNMPWYLRQNQTDIQIEPDGSVKGGSLQALIERLTPHKSIGDTTYQQTFTMTYKSFTTLDELFDRLVDRFGVQPPDGLNKTELEEWTKEVQVPVQSRVMNTMRSLMDEGMEKEDLYILTRLREFLVTEQAQRMTIAKIVLQKVDLSIQTGEIGRKITPLKQQPPPPILPKTGGKKIKLLDIDSTELARQLCILESQLYQKVRPLECLQRSRQSSAGATDNITPIILTANQIANWVGSCVLEREDSRKRAAIVKQFILVADKCRSLNNFSSMIAIVSGLNTPHIRRLKRTWEQVNARTLATLSTCEALLVPDKNFKNYRNALDKIVPPCVPFFGTYITTLTFIHDGNPDTLPGGLINFGKREMAADVMRDIKKWQAGSYPFQPVQAILGYIEESLLGVQDDQHLPDHFWNLSLEREPREREDEKMARLLQESGFL